MCSFGNMYVHVNDKKNYEKKSFSNSSNQWKIEPSKIACRSKIVHKKVDKRKTNQEKNGSWIPCHS